MRKSSVWILLGFTCAAAIAGYRLIGIGRDDGVASVPAGDQEVAWIHAATSTTAWERFVTGVSRVARDWPELSVDTTHAFSGATTVTPEIVAQVRGRTGRLRIRWYKLAQGATASDWTERLSRRSPPPLAVIGGGSSDRALDLAQAMANVQWQVAPLLFFTTATASGIDNPGDPMAGDLMRLYPHRTFRMCFTNAQMAQAAVDFVWSQPDLRPTGDPIPALPVVGLLPLDAAAFIASQWEQMAPSVSALEWEDDPYSVDLANQFYRVLHESAPGPVRIQPRYRIPYSVGGQYSPNQFEAEAVERLLAGLTASPMERQLLILPTNAAPARRVLRGICGALPLVGRSLVAVTGDSINLDNVFRDSDVGWNVRAIPVPIVFFSHQNPVDWDWPPPQEDRTWPPERLPTPAPPLRFDPDTQPPDSLFPPTKTDEVLLHRDLVRLLLQSAYSKPDGTAVVSDADKLMDRIRSATPPVFDQDGNRAAGRGEFLLCLRPQFADAGGANQVLSAATLEIWTRTGSPPQWIPVKRLILDNGRNTRSGS